jgi:single-strand DNA-binding protein
MQIITLSGRIGGDAETRTAGNGEVTSFSLAVDQGWGERKTTNWYRVSIWGDRGRKLAGHILKGNKLVVTGEFVIGEYQGKPQYEVRAHEVDPFMGAPSPRQSRADPATSGFSTTDAYPVDEEADSVPF